MEEAISEVVLLREILSRELETINTYQALLERAGTGQVVEFISHIIDEEKEHVAEAMELINHIDPKQAARFGAGAHYRKGLKGTAPVITEDDDVASPIDFSIRFTVGSLRDKK